MGDIIEKGAAVANYNMKFNRNGFKAGKIYSFVHNKSKGTVEVTADNDKNQSFLFSEFDSFFTLLKN